MNATSAPYQPKLGDVFVQSWGYDQTNLNWYQVTRVSPKGIFVREIGAKRIKGTEGFMCENQVPDINNFLTDSQWIGKKKDVGCFLDNSETFRKLRPDGKYFSVGSNYYASLWDGSPKYCSWYA
jgi:hypothetical protein